MFSIDIVYLFHQVRYPLQVWFLQATNVTKTEIGFPVDFMLNKLPLKFQWPLIQQIYSHLK